MALIYGFEEDDKGKAKFDALSVSEKTFFHDTLPWILMSVDIGDVNTSTIPHIDKRLFVYDDYLYRDIVIRSCGKGITIKGSTGITFADYLKKFIGFHSNVSTLTSSQYVAKLAKRIRRNIPVMTAKDVKNSYKG